MRVSQSAQRPAPELKMTPMIDVVFLLLVFFIWTSSFEPPEFDLPSLIGQTPLEGVGTDTSPAPAEAFDEIVIGLARREGNLAVMLNGQPIESLAALKHRLVEIIALGVQPPVVIDPADEITMNTAVAAYDTARAAGADRVLFAVDAQ